jgi:hypothetical protein
MSDRATSPQAEVQGGSFHIRNGVYFEGDEEGTVYLRIDDPEIGESLEMDITPDEWASVISFVSRGRLDKATYEAAKALHFGKQSPAEPQGDVVESAANWIRVRREAHDLQCGGEPTLPQFFGKDSEDNRAGADGYCRGCWVCWDESEIAYELVSYLTPLLALEAPQDTLNLSLKEYTDAAVEEVLLEVRERLRDRISDDDFREIVWRVADEQKVRLHVRAVTEILAGIAAAVADVALAPVSSEPEEGDDG